MLNPRGQDTSEIWGLVGVYSGFHFLRPWKGPPALGIVRAKRNKGREFEVGTPHTGPFKIPFFSKKLVTDVKSSRATPTKSLAHIFNRLDSLLSCICLDLLHDTIVVSCDLY